MRRSSVFKFMVATSTSKVARLLSSCRKFEPTQAVILSKLTRFEYEQIRNQDLDEDELRDMVSYSSLRSCFEIALIFDHLLYYCINQSCT